MNLEPDLGVQSRPGWETATILVTVKAYPVIGSKTGEAVCVAGIRLDTPDPGWVRLFPVPFRRLPPDRQFRKFQIVQLRIQRREGSDRRPESLHPDLDTLAVGPLVGTDGGTWRTRWELLEDRADETTMCALLDRARRRGQASPSLGLVRPATIHDVTASPNPAYRADSHGVHEIEDLFGTRVTPLEASPFIVKYRYTCRAVGCKSHSQTIVDWEAGALSRRLLSEGKQVQQVMAGVRHKFYDQMASASRDTRFFVGNQHQHPQSFLVIGVFWAPRHSRPEPTLF